MQTLSKLNPSHEPLNTDQVELSVIGSIQIVELKIIKESRGLRFLG
jgi:hypothetical protein